MNVDAVASLAVYQHGILSWFLPFFLSFLFFAPPDQSTGEVKMWVSRETFKLSMLLISCTTNTFVFTKSMKIYPQSAIFISLVYLWINWMLDILFLLPISGMSAEMYVADIGIRYLALPFVGWLCKSMYESDEWASFENFDGKHIALYYAPLAFVIPWAIAQMNATRVEEKAKNRQVDPMAVESSHYVVEVAVFVYFFLKSIGKFPTPSHCIYVSVVFCFTTILFKITFLDSIPVHLQLAGSAQIVYFWFTELMIKRGFARALCFIPLGVLAGNVLKIKDGGKKDEEKKTE